MTSQRWTLILLIVGVVVVGGMLMASSAEAAGEGCMPGGTPCNNRLETCIEVSTYTYQCVCRWGSLETDWFGLIPGSGESICSLVGSGSGVSAVWLLLGAATTAVIALTIMAALVSIVVGGYIYMTAGGSADRVRLAKVWIGSAILGIILALVAWLILASIAENLVQFT